MRNNNVILNSQFSVLRSRSTRRGVTLLLVLGLMTMFAMLVVTFMTVTTQARRTAEITSDLLVYGPKDGAWASSATGGSKPPFEEAMKQLLVGDAELSTVLGPHSILENLYGHPGYRTGAGNDQDPLVYVFPNTAADFEVQRVSTAGQNDPLRSVIVVNNFQDLWMLNRLPQGAPDFFAPDMNGYVLTVVAGTNFNLNSARLVGKSTLILKNSFAERSLQLAPFQFKDDETPLTPADQAAALPGCTFVVNSRPFSGTGPGYVFNQDAYNTDATMPLLANATNDNNIASPDDVVPPFALRPNILAPGLGPGQWYRDQLLSRVVMMNPDYTAPDYLNMFLAWNDVIRNGTDAGGKPIYQTRRVIPSFHRPDLVRYWANQGGLNSPEALQKIVLRPLRLYHPNFTGSNAAAAEAAADNVAGQVTFLSNGPWDVDNDGDGVQDGVWLDVGLPLQERDGKKYKPLVSYYVLDLDGRLNVNTAGNNAHAAPDFDPGESAGPVDKGKYGSVAAVRGMGGGVVEMRLDHGLGAVGNADSRFLLRGDDPANPGSSTRKGRYGADGEADDMSLSDANLIDGGTATFRRLNAMGIWPDTYITAAANDAFGGVMPDFWGSAALLFDPLGNRYANFTTGVPYSSGVNALYSQNPYLLDLFGGNSISKITGGAASTDNEPFKESDLQFLVRSPGDKSYQEVLGDTRLRHLLNDAPTSLTDFSNYRHFLTTQSVDIPAIPRLSESHRGLFEYLFYLTDGLTNGPDKAMELAKLFPEELWRGEKINLDRIAMLDASTHNNNLLPRERLRFKCQFAQGIFHFMLILHYDELFPGGTANQVAVDRIAQWSVNLVDYLDTDAVMTPLIYVQGNPFTAATIYNFLETDTVTGDAYGNDFDACVASAPFTLGANQKLIFGMEQPEVALTKTFAIHNRRVADSQFGGGNSLSSGDNNICSECGRNLNRILPAGVTCDNATQHDENFDQVMVPQGSLFLELYRTGNPNRQSNEEAMYTKGANGRPASLNLGAIVGGVASGAPIWRIAISERAKTQPSAGAGNVNDVFGELAAKGTNYTFQPKQWHDSAPAAGNSCDVVTERYIWFTPEAGLAGEPRTKAEARSYYNRSHANEVQLEPNEYLVIGPRTVTSFLSKPVSNTPDVATQSDRFGTPNGSANTLIDLSTYVGGSDYKAPKIMIAAAPVVSGKAFSELGTLTGTNLGQGIGLSASEPLPKADVPETNPGDGDGVPGYYPAGTAADPQSYVGGAGTEIDLPSDYELEEVANGFGTITRYKSVFLQRLADPGRAYNEVTNPYITVDWNMIDLHVINGESDTEGLKAHEEPDLAFNENLYFAMRQWGYSACINSSATHGVSLGVPNIWDRTVDLVKADADDGGLRPTPLTGVTLEDIGNDHEKLKYENTTIFGRLANCMSYPDPPDDDRISDADITAAGLDTHVYKGAPQRAFLHFPWNNGPMSSSYELMLVPSSTQGRFGFEFHAPVASDANDGWWTQVPSLGTGTNAGTASTPPTDPSDPSTGTPAVAGDVMPIHNPATLQSPYFNFFLPKDKAGSLGLSKVFDFVRVPSCFAGTVRGFVPEWAGGGWFGFRTIYEMREPGRVNLNTANEAAWYALIGQSQADTLSNGPASWLFERFKLSRQLDPDNPPADLPPSDFYAPFRSSSSSRFVPRDTLIRTSTETSLFRKTWDATGTTLVDDPVFKPRQPAADYGTNGDGRATNMLTSLSDVIRRGDMVTNRSNVFAVWVTIGYFEADEFVAADANGALQTKYPVLTHVNATNFNAIYPDGVVLGVERGLTDGTVTRHRKFYMIDRTIPVGFRRGGVARYHDGTNQQTAELKNYTDVIVNGADGLTLD